MTPRPKPTPKATPPKPAFGGLEEAANLLVDAMPTQPVRDILREAASAQHIPLWMLVCGLLQKAYDTGEQSAPVLDPLWLHSAPVTMGGYAEVVCRCGATFRPRWPGQRFCNVECGVAAYRDRIAADREDHVVELATYAVGQEPADRARSTIRYDESDERGDAPRPAGEAVGLVGGVPSGADDPVAQIEQDAKAGLQVG